MICDYFLGSETVVWSACLSACFLSICLFMSCTLAPNVIGLDYIFAVFLKIFCKN